MRLRQLRLYKLTTLELPENLDHPDVEETSVLCQVIKYTDKDAEFELDGESYLAEVES